MCIVTIVHYLTSLKRCMSLLYIIPHFCGLGFTGYSKVCVLIALIYPTYFALNIINAKGKNYVLFLKIYNTFLVFFTNKLNTVPYSWEYMCGLYTTKQMNSVYPWTISQSFPLLYLYSFSMFSVAQST